VDDTDAPISAHWRLRRILSVIRCDELLRHLSFIGLAAVITAAITSVSLQALLLSGRMKAAYLVLSDRDA
jgi:hypothetical protein